MKNIILGIWVIALSLFAQALFAQGFSLKGNIAGLGENSKVYLIDENNPTDTSAKAKVQHGSFELKGKFSEPNLYVLGFTSPAGKVPVFIGNDNMTISGEASNLKALKLTGSQSNDDFMEFQKTFGPYIMKLNSLTQLANSPEGAGKSDSITREYSYTVTKVQAETDKYLESQKSSYLTPFLLYVTRQ
ncbi:MAG: DUF4369 domain-containing protein [Chitinophagales bacterium]